MSWTKKIIEQYLQEADSGYGLVIGACPVKNDPLGKPEIEYPLPDGVKSLYQDHDGFGLVTDNNKLLWRLPPRSKLLDLKASCCNWFSETHPELVDSVFPFIDGFTGSYLLGLVENGQVSPGIFEFDHERYDFVAQQPWDQFICKVYDDFEEYFEL